MKRTAALLAWFFFGAGVGGCAHGPRAGESPSPLALAGWQGPPPRVAVLLAGSGATPDGQHRCDAALLRAGAVVDARSSAQAVVTLEPQRNRLTVLTPRRGQVADERRPDWSVEQLCEDALTALAGALRDESSAAPPGTSTAAESSKPSYEAIPDPRHDGMSHASGGIYRSPISN